MSCVSPLATIEGFRLVFRYTSAYGICYYATQVDYKENDCHIFSPRSLLQFNSMALYELNTVKESELVSYTAAN